MIIVDTSGLLANYDSSDRHHAAAVRVMARPQRRILSPFVLAELDYLISKIAGQSAELAVLEDVARGAFELERFREPDVEAARSLIERYADLRLGLADASVAVLAERHHCYDLLTLDQRHFRAIRGPRGEIFRLLLQDAM